MTFDRSEFQQRMKARTTRVNAAALHSYAREALEAEKLTGDPAWDQFKERIQSGLSSLEAHMAAIDAEWHGPRAVSGDALLALKMDYALKAAQRDILKAIVEMPYEVIRTGEAATKLLAEIGILSADESPRADSAA